MTQQIAEERTASAEGLIIVPGAFVVSRVAPIPDHSAAAFAAEVPVLGL